MSSIASPTYDVTLVRLVYGGNAMGRLPDGRAVFVPFGLPGEIVQIKLLEEKRGHAQAELIKVLEPSPERIVPRCIHFSVCGVCHYQHMPYPVQLMAKRQIIIEQLERLGGIQSPPVVEVIPSPNQWYYRNNVQFHLTPDGKLGYQAALSNRVMAIQECHLPEPPLNELWPQLDMEAIPGLERIALRLGHDDEGMIIFEGDELELPELDLDIDLSVVHLGQAETIILAGDGHLVMQVLDRPFRVSAGSFFQINIRQAENMIRHLLDQLPLNQNTTLLELYCGVGLFSAFLASRVKRLVGVEISPTACDDFVINLDEFDNVDLYQGAAEAVLPGLEMDIDVLVVDPPRAGIALEALGAILKLKPKYLAYISCDPSTLARDVKRLVAGGYQLERVTPFDMFPHTFHIESIALMKRIETLQS